MIFDGQKSRLIKTAERQRKVKMQTFILTKVHSCSANNEPKDLAKGLNFIVVVETTKRIGDLVVPDFIKTKSAIKVDPSPDPQLLEVEVFNINGQGGARVQTYYRIIRKAELAGGKK